jgi:capsular exopolysaccharide synthesis family protein
MNNKDNLYDVDNDSIDLINQIRYYLFFWPWFLVSVLISSFSSYLYLRYADTIYETNATLQVKDASSDPSSFLAKGAGAMFNFDRVKIDNYIAQISSKPNLSKVVDILDLQTQVISVGRINKDLEFGENIPFQIDYKNKKNKFYEIKLILEPSKGLIVLDKDEFPFDTSQPFENDDFVLTVNSSQIEKQLEFIIRRASKDRAIENLLNSIVVFGASETGDNINFSLEGPNIKRNEAILNEVIEVAQLQQIKDKQKIYGLSIDFINKRLVTIKNEIDSLTMQTTGFKSDNLIFSPELQTTTALTSLTTLDQEQFNLTTQKALAKSLKSKLKNQDKFSLLPSNIGLESANVNKLVLSYNELILKRKNLLAGARSKNPIVIQASEQLTDLKANIFISIDNYISYINTSLERYKEFTYKTNFEVSKIPQLEASLLGFERKFQIAEKLYLFLLELREEASISFESTLPDTRIINFATTRYKPISPRKELINIGALLLGLLFPFVTLYILKLLDTKINTREDLEDGIKDISILGEVPLDENYTTEYNDRGIIAESTRVIRSNMSFLLKEAKAQVIITTSTIKGEGKSFVSFNIAKSYKSLGKKVLLIGADLRNPQVHTLLGIERGNLGLSTFLNDVNYNDLDKLIVKGKSVNEMDYLLSGAIPPNPSELLMRPRMKELLEILKSSYDIIILDTAPLLLVSDTTPLLPLCDLVVYVSRAQYSDKNIFPFIREMHSRENMPPFGMVLNALIASASSSGYGYGYRYSYKYRYSYSYKYNYGYGYGYGRDKE